MMRSFHRLTAAAAAAVSLAGCATLTVGSYAQSGINFKSYRTYAWGEADALPTGDPRLDANPFFKDRLAGAVERGMRARGFELADADAPDLLVHYHANITQRVDVNRVDRQNGYCYGQDCTIDIMEYEAGTLVLDVVDARTKRVIWRGWAQDSVEGVLGNQDRMERLIDQAVDGMLQQFPG
jgi:hypothetical protein